MTSTNHFRMSMRALPHTHSCFVCGERNVHGLQLRFETDGTLVKTKFTPGEEHIGFQNVTHGGILATVLDEIMVWACAVATRRFAYCAEMSVRFQKPAIPNQQYEVVARMDENRKGRILVASGEIVDEGGAVLAQATGKYRPLDPAQAKGMLSDVVGDISWLE
ncbi:MAG: hypothetical protein ACJASX_001593 [Limisphaerales bacterium]|jgi:uncharacterized protein (TIGR00369 family)